MALTVVRSGAGSRLKVVEAMAQQVPLVSTRFASKGFDLSDGNDVIFAETAEEIAKGVVKLYKDRQLSDQLTESAYRKYQKLYAAEVIERKISALAKNALNNSKLM